MMLFLCLFLATTSILEAHSPLSPFGALAEKFSPFFAQTAVAPLDHVADANARLSIDPTGKTAGYRVIQDDGPTLYEFLGAGLDEDAGVWVAGAGDNLWGGPYFWDMENNRYSQLPGFSDRRIDSGPFWEMSGQYTINSSATYPWQVLWGTIGGTPPAPAVTRDPMTNEVNWSIVP